MSNLNYEENGKKFLKCKECGEFKELNDENWYKHKQGFMGVLGRCKLCIKKGRSSEHELVMARIRDKKRWKENPKRRKQLLEAAIKRFEIKGYRNIHLKTSRYINKLGIRPIRCPICGCENRIYAHHPDYNKRYEVVFVCMPCHSRIHSGKILCPTPINLLDSKYNNNVNVKMSCY